MGITPRLEIGVVDKEKLTYYVIYTWKKCVYFFFYVYDADIELDVFCLFLLMNFSAQ